MKPALTPDRFARALNAAASLFEVPATAVCSGSRLNRPTAARIALYTALYRACETTMAEIGALLGRDHTTVLSGIRQGATRAASDGDYQAALDLIADAVRA